MDTINNILTRGIANIIPNREKLAELLAGEKKLNIYLGIDPTATRIHLGHAVPLRKLQQFSQLGHHVTFLIGDFTALIGDTSDKETERPVLTPSQIEENFRTYKKQAEKLLDFSKITVRHNSEWLSKLGFADIIKLTYHFSAGDFYGRELIKKRLQDGKRVGLHEVLYPVMQGYDSYFLDTDIQLGGTDQTFNMQAGRILQKDLRQKESFIIANGFLPGTDGRKMSKTWNNAIWLTDSPQDIFGKVMSLRDELITEYFNLATNLTAAEISRIQSDLTAGGNPMEFKKLLARTIVSELYGSREAINANEAFTQTFQNKNTASELLDKYETGKSEWTLLELVNACSQNSKTQSRKLIEQNAVMINDSKISDSGAVIKLKNGDIIKIGKKKFIKIHLI